MKRRVRTVILFLLLGAIINLAVAWGCVKSRWSGPYDWSAPNRPDETHIAEGVDDYDQSEFRVLVLHYRSVGADIRQFVWVAHGVVLALEARAGFPCESLAGKIVPRESDPAYWYYDLSSGKPWHIPHSMFVCADQPATTSYYPVAFRRCLPFGIIWPGFAINTVFYAAVLWLLFAAPFALRRQRRIKRGLWPKCAYPIGTSNKCTECGAAVTPIDASGDRALLQSRL